MEELAEKIRTGTDVSVVDVTSGEDLTGATLTQIIVEGRGAARLLPVPLLTQLIRMGDDSLAEFFGHYMTGALELYLRAKRGAQAVAPYNPFATLPFQASDALARLLMSPMQLFGGRDAGAPPPAPTYTYAPEPEPAPAPTASTDDQMAALRRELQELREAVAPKPRKRPAKKKS
jgi:polyhydroxyalkanoate synthesis regulator protein